MSFWNSDQQLLERIRTEIRSRLVSAEAPEAVETFLLRHWAVLMRDIFVAHGGEHPDWLAGWDTVDALVWSLTPKQGRMETERLLRLLPVLIGRLEEGCQALALAESETAALFSRLADLHARLARSGTAPSDESAPGTPGGDAASNRVADGPSVLDTLRPGDWVTFHGADGDKRLRLKWVSASGAMYLFDDGQGLDALSLTRSRLEERLAAGGLRLG
jgi:hypothetical protein